MVLSCDECSRLQHVMPLNATKDSHFVAAGQNRAWWAH